jgi:hypothetical protein
MPTNVIAKAVREMEKAQARAAKEEARRLKEEQKDMARQAVEQEKAAARAEVDAFERELEKFTGLHKLPPRFFSWSAQHFSLPPHPPAFHSKHHLREAAETILLTRDYESLEGRLAEAWTKDELGIPRELQRLRGAIRSMGTVKVHCAKAPCERRKRAG